MKVEILSLVAVLAVVGCGKEKTNSYTVPETADTESGVSGLPAGHPEIPMGGGAMGSDTENQAIVEAHQAMMETMPQSAFEAELPEGWTEKEASGMRMASYAIEDSSIDFYLISLTMGDVPGNVNRWRGQVGLPAASPEDIAAEVEVFEVEQHNARYIEIYNEEGGNGIIAAIIDLSPNYWYFTAKGSVEELKANADDIRKFIESIEFVGHNH